MKTERPSGVGATLTYIKTLHVCHNMNKRIEEAEDEEEEEEEEEREEEEDA